MAGQWIYFFGERSGADMKIGITGQPRAVDRLKAVHREQTTDAQYVCLAAVRGSRAQEAAIKRHFDHLQREDKGTKKEYFRPEAELVEYAAWVRAQWWASADGEDRGDDWTTVDPDVWLPDGPARRLARPDDDPEKIIQDYDALGGRLAGTPWAWFPDPKASIQDYFTPAYLIDAVRTGMDGLDLDAASHWLANRQHRIPRYFTIGYSAFDHDWTTEGGDPAKVWLNPPFGYNSDWWPRVVEQVEAGYVEQICILSPVWTFTTGLAKPLMQHVSATVLLTPTPKWWGNPNDKVGSNHPHAIVYIGHRTDEVLTALEPWGIPMQVSWDRVGERSPESLPSSPSPPR